MNVTTVWLLVALQWVMPAGTTGLVLCIERSGEVVVETRQTGETCHGPAAPSDCTMLLPRADDCCSDSIVSQPGARSANGADVRDAISAWATVAEWQAPPMTAAIRALRVAHPPPSSSARVLASVVLLV